MKKNVVLCGLIALVCASALAHDFDLVENEIGDCRLVTLGGYTLARPVTITLLSSYKVSCQVIYKDLLISRPNEDDWEQLQYTGDLLNTWLASYIRGECDGEDLDALCESYANLDFVKNLQDGFSDYVKERIEEMPAAQRIRVEAVTVTVRAEGTFRRELLQRKNRELRLD